MRRFVSVSLNSSVLLFMPKPQRYCIFCGGAGLSKEHLYAKWLRDYIPRVQPRHGIESTVYGAEGTTHETQWRDGDIHSRKVRRVCKACNNGWMSSLQTDVRPFLVPMLEGDATSLNRRAQKIIAAWASMAVMVGEHVIDDMAAVPQSDRDYLRQWQAAPPSWRIWIANYKPSNTLSHWTHNAMALADERDEVEFYADAAPNTQTTAACFGKHLFVYAMSSSHPFIAGIIRRWGFDPTVRASIRQIFPAAAQVVRWPPGRVLTGREANRIGNEFFVTVRARLAAAQSRD